MGKLFESFGISCTDCDYILEKKGRYYSKEESIQARIGYLRKYGKPVHIDLKSTILTSLSRSSSMCPISAKSGGSFGCG